MVQISFSAELTLGVGQSRPKHRYQTLSNDDLLIFYTFVNHTEHRDNNEVIEEMVAVQLGKAEPSMPRVIANFKDPTREITKRVASVATEPPDRLNELREAVRALYTQQASNRAKAKADEDQKRNESDVHLEIEELPMIASLRATETEILDIYAAVCLYEYEIRGSQLRGLLGDLARIGGPTAGIPKFVKNFIKRSEDNFTLKVKMLAEMEQESLLGRVDAVCQRYTPSQSTSMVPLRAKKSTQSRPSSPVSTPVVTGNHPQSLQPVESRITPGYVNIGSAYGPPIMQPVGGGGSTTSRPSLRLTDPEELEHEFLSKPPPEGVYEQHNPVSRRSLPSIFSNPGDGQGPLLSQHPESFPTPQWTSVNREVFAPNNAEFLDSTSSSRGSASSKLADQKSSRVGGRSLEDSEEKQWQEGG